MKLANLKTVTPQDTTQQPTIFDELRWLVPILSLHLAITLPLARLLNIWIDEASTLDTTGKGLRYAFSQALNYELQAPLYFVLLNLWRTISHSIFHARLFSVVCVVMALFILAGVSRRFIAGIHPAWMVAATAFNPFTIWAATETRVYALVLLLVSILMLNFYDGYLAGNSRRARWTHAIVALIALYTYYYLGFLLLAQAVALLPVRRWRAAWDFCLAMVAVGVGFAPMLWYLPQQIQGYTSTVTQRPTLSAGLQSLSWRLQSQILPTGWKPLEMLGRVMMASLLILTLFLIVRKVRQSLAPAHLALWAISVVMALCMLLACLATAITFLESRHTTVLFFPATLSVFALLAVVARKQGVIIWACIVILFSVVSDTALYRHPTKNGEWSRVAAYLKASERPNQPILVSQPLSAVPLSYYYSGANSIVPVPAPEDFRTFNGPEKVLKDEEQLESLLEKTDGHGERFWLVTDERCNLLGRNLNCEVLERFVAARYEIEQDRGFFHSRVRLLRRKAN